MAKDKPISDPVSLYSFDENVNHCQNSFLKKCPKYINNGNNIHPDVSQPSGNIDLDLVSNVPEMCNRKSTGPFDYQLKESVQNMYHPLSCQASTSDVFYENSGGSKSLYIDKPEISSTVECEQDSYKDQVFRATKDACFQDKTSNQYKNVYEGTNFSVKIDSKQEVLYCNSEQNHSEAGPDIAQYIESCKEFTSNSNQSLSRLKTICLSEKSERIKYCDIPACNVNRGICEEDFRMASDVANDVPTSNVLINFGSTPKKLDHNAFSEEEFTHSSKMQELHYQEKPLKKDKEINEHMKNLEKEKQILKGQIMLLQKSSRASIGILEELLKILNSWMTVKEHERVEMAGENQKLINDRDQALEDLKCVETAFADLHRRYENCKAVLEGYKQNEDRLKQQSNDIQARLKQQEQMYEMLRTRTQDKLDSANTEIENAKKSGDAELAVIRVQLKKAEMRISSLEKDIEQKNKENIELSSICDDLIAKVGKS